MKKITFDTNCIIDIDESRENAPYVLSLLQAHRENKLDAAFVAVSASERQKGDYYLPAYSDFTNRLEGLGIGDIPHIPGMAYYEISYWENALWADDEMVAREHQIHSVLFPKVSFETPEARFLQDGSVTRELRNWLNAWCDRQIIWAHDFHQRDVFVTGDRNFYNLVGKPGFESLVVCTPPEALELVRAG